MECNFFPRECKSVDGCAYDMKSEECTETPEFSGNCNVFDGYGKECEDSSDCGIYNLFE